MTNILDNTVGVFICVSTLKFIEKKLELNNKTGYISGNYYTKF